ncbi:MAG TPA: hypothetical protein VK590_13010 [Saprospiraceae bacterium]|nr:hypothetical protein [Saprospiraceae bacterium]
MKSFIYGYLSLIIVLFTSCQDENYKNGYNAGYIEGITVGYNKGHEDGFAEGNIEGLSKSSEGLILFDNVNPNLWKVINWICILTILISLVIVSWGMIFTNKKSEDWRQILAKMLVILLSLLTSYLIIPKINLIWFFNPGLNIYEAIISYILTIIGVFISGKYLVDLFYSRNEIILEIFIIFVSSFFLWFMGYILINNKYLFGDRPLFGNNLIICFTLGIIGFIIYSLLYPRTLIKKA